MTELERKGKRIILGIALIVCLPPLLSLGSRTISGAQVAVSDWFGEFVVPAVLCWLMLLGRKWARMVAVVVFGLMSSALILMIILFGGSARTQFTLACFSVIYGTSATILWASPAVDAYLEGRNAAG